jgi:hypothetical protein
MIYKFKSKAAGDVIMLGPNGDRVLGLIGKDAGGKGIIEPAQMPAAIAALQAAIEADDAARAAPADEQDPQSRPEAISLRQRAWPLVEMMRRAHAADEPITWGV